MSLKHRNTSKWAKKQSVYAKYNEKARDQVQEQLELSKKLTKKVKDLEYAEESDEESKDKKDAKGDLAPINPALEGLLADNPWTKMMSGVGGVLNDLNGAKKVDEDDYSKPKAFKDVKAIQKAQDEVDDETDDDEDGDDVVDRSNIKDVIHILNDDEEETEKLINETSKQEIIKTPEVISVPSPKLVEVVKEHVSSDEKKEVPKMEANLRIVESVAPVELKIKHDETQSESSIKKANNRATGSKEHQLTLAEAFADDDVIEEFKSEKVFILLIDN